MELLQFKIHDVREPFASFDGIEQLNQFLLLLDGKHKVGADDVRQPSDILNLDSRKHLIDVRVLAEL
jgi:hypothetical protein